MKRLAVLTILLLPLAACAHPQANEPAYRQAFNECDYESAKATASALSVADRVANRVDLNKRCMALKGY